MSAVYPGRSGGELVVPHIGIHVPKEALGARRGVQLIISGPECDWTLPEIYEQALDEVAERYKPNIPDTMPPADET